MKKVLVVEDTEMIRTLLTTYLQRYDCDVFEAENGRIGLALAVAERPDLVLLDVAMPGMDGREVLEHLRRIRATRDVPVIMVTAISERDVVLSILKSGVTAYLVKPIDRDRFDAEVGKVLGPPRARHGGGARPTAAGQGDARPAPKVLVVDDSPRILFAVRQMLDGVADVVTAATGREALAVFQQERPAAVLIDLFLRGMDSGATLRALRLLDLTTRFIGLSVRGDRVARQRAQDEGFHAVLEKPLVADELRAELSSGASAMEVCGCVRIVRADGVPVLSPPADPRGFHRFVTTLPSLLRQCIEDGDQSAILDLEPISGPSMGLEVAKGIIASADVGMRLAVAGAEPAVRATLGEIVETSGLLFAATTDEAARKLRDKATAQAA